ncbi:MAG TPA: ceramidase domain-containing protein [Bryobacteraceae bacterium]|nr:ceramidase domain-containing protein [Bryobacteraceae bacterium]
MISARAALWLLVLIAAVVAAIAMLVPPIPQPQWYHMFADQRSFLGIPNFNNVVSNFPFAAVGLWGLVFLIRASYRQDGRHFLDRRERWPYLMVFVGLILTAAGSSYYHLQPDNTTLVWDRLPMVIVMMSLLAAIVAERVSLRAGLWLMPLLLFIGLSSVLQWRMSELRGAGDLRFYAAVQLYSVLFLVIALLLPSRYTRGRDLAIVAGFYVLAKILEALDRPIFDLGHVVSGHTLKHLAAAGAGYWILRMLWKRRPLALG